MINQAPTERRWHYFSARTTAHHLLTDLFAYFDRIN